MHSTTTRASAAVPALRALATIVAATFLLASPIHLGFQILLGFPRSPSRASSRRRSSKGPAGFYHRVVAAALLAGLALAWSAAVSRELRGVQ